MACFWTTGLQAELYTLVQQTAAVRTDAEQLELVLGSILA